MKKICFLFCSIFLIASCKKVDISNQAFEYDRNTTCNDLYEAGYKRMFGVDVILIGKVIPHGQIHYQLEELSKKSYEEVYTGVNEMIERNDSSEVDQYEKYRQMNPLELSDSIYELAWEPIKVQQEYLCSEGNISIRYYQKEIINKERFKNSIDKDKYQIIESNKENESDFFKVLNLKNKDIFDCYFSENNGKLLFFSQLKINEYE